MDSIADVRRLDLVDHHAATKVITEAFHPLAVAAWLVADPAERRRTLYANFAIHVAHAMIHGQVWSIGERDAVAVWLLRDEIPDPPGVEDHDYRLTAATGPHQPRFETLDKVFDQHHPTAAHHHLAFLAVTPHRQGKGLGSLLLERHLWHLDQARIPAYLEATSVDARRLYLRHGFRDHGPPIDLPDGPRIWPMWRAAHRRAAEAGR